VLSLRARTWQRGCWWASEAPKKAKSPPTDGAFFCALGCPLATALKRKIARKTEKANQKIHFFLRISRFFTPISTILASQSGCIPL